ncbi:MAG TPA: histidine kinase [Ruminiclostridium sp.]
MKKRFFSLRYKLWSFTLLLSLVPGIVMLTVAYRQNTEVMYERACESSVNTVSQIGNNIEYIMDDVRALSLYLIQNNDVRTFMNFTSRTDTNIYMKYETSITDSLMHFVGSKKVSNSWYIKGFNDVMLASYGNYESPGKEIIDLGMSNKGMFIWVPNKMNYSSEKNVRVFSLVRLLRDINNISNNLGTIKIDVREDEIADLYQKKTGNAELTILNYNNTVISSLDKNAIGKPFKTGLYQKLLNQNESGHYTEKKDGIDYFYAFYNVSDFKVRVLSVTPVSAMKSTSGIPLAIGLGFIISIAFCTIFSGIFSRTILNNLNKLRGLMQSIENERFDKYIKINSNDEMQELAESFNKMSVKLKFLITEVYAGKIKHRESEIMMLQAQIDPHFLYNTLDTIYWMARVEKANETCEMITALSQLFRMSTRIKKPVITLREESEYLRNYLIIQKKRFQNSIEIVMSLEAETLDCIVVKQCLQPLVENAICHGIEKNGGKGKIEIFSHIEGELLELTVKDTGGNIDLDEIVELLTSNDEVNDNMKGNKGFAIRNVNDRVKIYFGKTYGLEYHNQTGCYTEAVLTLPVKKNGGIQDDKTSNSRG